MSIEMFCPKWYYLGTVSDDKQKEIQDLFDEFLSNDENFTAPEHWHCNVSTTIYNDSNLDAPWSELLDCLREQINQFLEETQPTKDIELIFQRGQTNINNGTSKSITITLCLTVISVWYISIKNLVKSCSGFMITKTLDINTLD